MTGKPKQPKQTAPNWGGHRTNQIGRRPKAEGERASVQVAFRLTPKEEAAIMALAREGETLHSACKRLAVEASKPAILPAVPDPVHLPNLVKCRECGKMFDPWHSLRRCPICHEPLTPSHS